MNDIFRAKYEEFSTASTDKTIKDEVNDYLDYDAMIEMLESAENELDLSRFKGLKFDPEDPRIQKKL